MSREKSLIKNTIILMIGTVLPRIINLATTPIISKYTTGAQFGYMDFITSTVLSFVVPICTLQMEQALFRFLIDAKSEKEKKVVITSGFALIFAIMAVIGVVCIFLPIDDFTGSYKLLLVAYIWIEIICQMSRFILRAFSMYKEYSVLAALTVVVNFIALVICLLVFKTGYMGVLIALTIADVVGIIYVIFKSKMLSYIRVSCFDREVMMEMLKFSLPFVPNMVSWYVNLLSSKWIIIAVMGNGANGIYAMANKIPSIVNILYPAFNLAWTESATRSVEDEDSSKYYSKMFKMIFCVLSGGTACLLAICPYLFSFLNKNPKLNGAFDYIPPLVIATYFYCFAQFFSSIYIAIKSGKNMSISTTIAAVINVGINIALINFIGIWSAVAATFISNFALVAYRYYDINKNYYRIKINKRLMFLTIFVFIIIVASYWSKDPILWILSLVIALGYAYFITGDVFMGMLKSVLSKRNRS